MKWTSEDTIQFHFARINQLFVIWKMFGVDVLKIQLSAPIGTYREKILRIVSSEKFGQNILIDIQASSSSHPRQSIFDTFELCSTDLNR